MKTRNIMLDLETMGCGPTAAIIAIGACEFDNRTISQMFYRAVTLTSSVREGGVMDASTVLWWMSQTDEARLEFTKLDSLDIVEALQQFSCWLQQLDTNPIPEPYMVAVWGNGVRFDNEILSSAYTRMGLPVPWSYKCDRCYRTIKGMFPEIKVENSGTAHNALDDSIYQAKHLQKIVKQTGLLI